MTLVFYQYQIPEIVNAVPAHYFRAMNALSWISLSH